VGKGDRQEAHDERASLLANLYFDLVLVHADPRVARLEDTFSPATPMRVPVEYTGFVSARIPTRRLDAQRHGPVLVSVGGGGRSPEQLTGAAVEAHERNWPGLRLPTKIVAGPFYPEAGWHRLRAQVEGLEGIELRRTVPDLVDELGRSQASVSQCGYNTATELLLTGVPALVVPVAEGPEGEQLRRARLLERLGAVRVLEPGLLDGGRLAVEIAALRSFRPAAPALDTNGVAGTVAALGRMLDRRVVPEPARPVTVMPA
jgi:predicted glycosyltransferase